MSDEGRSGNGRPLHGRVVRLFDDAPPSDEGHRSFEVHGVHVGLASSDPEILDRLVGLLPPEAKPCPPETVVRRWVIWEEEDGTGWRYDNGIPAGVVGNWASPVVIDLDLAISVVDSQLRLFVGAVAPAVVFVHAGVVAVGGRAIVMPGHSFSGKSTLVAALVSAGATYFSDEYAILDERGLVHPYARPLSIREPDSSTPASRPVESFGGTAGVEPVPVGVIAATKYVPGASWEPERRSPGEGALTLLSHALPAKERPAETLAAARAAAAEALILEGDRGDADATARELLDTVASLGDRATTS